MVKKQGLIKESRLRKMIAEAVDESINELIDGEENEMTYKVGDMLSTDDLIDYIEKGKNIGRWGRSVRIPGDTGFPDCAHDFDDSEWMMTFLKGSRGDEFCLYLNCMRKCLTDDDVEGWVVTYVGNTSIHVKPKFKDPEIQKAWYEDMDREMKRKGEYIRRWGSN